MLHYFNPGHEAAVLNASPYYIPPANVRHMQHDLAFLPAWYAEPGDQVLLPAPLDPAYARLLRQHFPTLPRPVTPAEVTSDTVAPWGISLQAIHYLYTIASQQKIPLQLPTWHDAYRYLNSRTAARDCLERLLGMLPNIDPALLPHPLEHLDDVQTFVRQSPHAWLAKAPYSSSGRGLLWLPRYGLPEKTIEVLRGILHKQGLVYVERVLDKVVDFSMQFVCDNAGHTRFVGYSHFTTNARGAYTGNNNTSSPFSTNGAPRFTTARSEWTCCCTAMAGRTDCTPAWKSTCVTTWATCPSYCNAATLLRRPQARSPSTTTPPRAQPSSHTATCSPLTRPTSRTATSPAATYPSAPCFNTRSTGRMCWFMRKMSFLFKRKNFAIISFKTGNNPYLCPVI